MATFLAQLFGFGVLVWIVTKYAVPPIRGLMAAQRETVQHQLDAGAKAAERLAAADSYHAARVEEARVEARQIVEEARADAVRIDEQLRAQSVIEAERIRVQGGEQVSLARTQLVRQLRGDLGGESVRRAADLVRAHVTDPQALSATVDRFLDELDAMASAASTGDATASDLRSASRDARTALVTRFDAVAAPMSGEQLTALSEELTAVVTLLLSEPILARHLAEATGEAEAKKQMLARLLSGKVSTATLELLDTVAAVRWSTTSDAIDAVEHVARLALLVRADRDGQADEVAEQLFRFERVLEGQPELNTLLSDHSRAAGDRVSLLRDVLSRAGGTNAVAGALLAQTVRLMRGERADEAVAELAQLAVSHRGEIVAEIGAAAELSDAQRSRLTQILTRIYHHPVSVQLNVDPALLGGLSVAVGDEVIDATLSSRLVAAASKLPD